LALEFGTIVRSHGVKDDETNSILPNSHGYLVAQDMVLGLEVGGYDADYRVEGRFWICRVQDRVVTELLGETRGRECAFG
jgi:hypothetical protein